MGPVQATMTPRGFTEEISRYILSQRDTRKDPSTGKKFVDYKDYMKAYPEYNLRHPYMVALTKKDGSELSGTTLADCGVKKGDILYLYHDSVKPEDRQQPEFTPLQDAPPASVKQQAPPAKFSVSVKAFTLDLGVDGNMTAIEVQDAILKKITSGIQAVMGAGTLKDTLPKRGKKESAGICLTRAADQRRRRLQDRLLEAQGN